MVRPPLFLLICLSFMVVLSAGVGQPGVGRAEVTMRGTERDPDTVIVDPAEVVVVHNPAPQTTEHLISMQNTQPFSVQFTIVEAPVTCDEPSSVAWISIAPSAGTIPAQGTRQPNIFLTSGGLPPGWNTALFCITTTDPQSPLIEVPVNLHVGPLPTATPTPITPTSTPTPVPPTETPTITPSPEPPTATPTEEPPTATPTVTNTPPPGATFTPTHTPTSTVPPTPTTTPTVTNTPPPGATFTATPTATTTPPSAATFTPTVTVTTTPAVVASVTPTATTTTTPFGNRLYLPMIRRR